jgi:hypothetical protein
MVLRIVSVFCVATVFTQLLVLGVLAVRGNLDSDKVVKIVALTNGIDITGDRLQEMLDESQTREVPSFSEVLTRRAVAGLDMDLQRHAIDNYSEQVEAYLRELQEKTSRFDLRREAFNARLDDLEKGQTDEGMRELQRTLEVLPPDLAKTQLLMSFDEGEIDKVVNIVQAMNTDKRKKILSEFQGPAEEEKLAEILRRLGEGEPLKSLIEDAREGQ